MSGPATSTPTRTGPLAGVRLLEFAGLGPAPFAAMVLSDLGADIVCIDRPGDKQPVTDPLRRGRRSIAVDLKAPGAVELVRSMIAGVDGLIEGFRPGVMERLGLGPDDCLAVNERLVYGRMTGWGQDGPLASAAGHDINYIGLAGVLHHIGRAGQPPVAPVNFVGDFGGGGMLLCVGMLAALLEARVSGRGQVVDAAMVDGAALLSASLYGLRAEGRWNSERGTNLIDSGAPFYDVYETADGGFVAVGALERRFYGELLRVTGLDPDRWPNRFDRSCWPGMRAALAAVFATATREEWTLRFAGADACVTPVLTQDEALAAEHNTTRATFTTVDGVVQPAPAPRFSRTPAAVSKAGSVPGADTVSVLNDFGLDAGAVAELLESGVVAAPPEAVAR